MQFSQKSRLETLQRIQWFMDHNQSALGAVNQSRSRAALDALVPVLEAHAKAQHTAEVEAQSRTEIKSQLRNDLRVHHMQQIAAIARSQLAGVASAPLMAKLQYPPRHLDDKGLVSAGQSMAEAALQYKQVFLDEKLPSDFLEQLQAATEAVRSATADRDGSQLNLRAATQGVTVQLQQASHVTRVLHTLVLKRLKGNAELLSAWQMAKRHRAKPGMARTPATTGRPAPTPSTVSSTQPTQPTQPAEVKAF